MNNVVTDPDDARILRACKLVNWTAVVRAWSECEAPPVDLLQFADVVLSALAPKEHQHAPCPDYRMSEPAAEPVEVCSCEEALALRRELANLKEVLTAECKASSEHHARAVAAEAEIAEVWAEVARYRAALEQEQTARAAWAEKAVTAADKAVLDATGAAPQWSLLLHAGPDVEGTWTHAAAHAELARRGWKP